MNYLAHGLPFLERPWALAGVALPDWLRVVDKRARLRPPDVDDDQPHDARELLHGVRRHHTDDARFHTDAQFDALTAEMVQALRATDSDPRARASTTAHIAVELLLDGAVLTLHPRAASRYYDALEALDAERLTTLTRAFTARPLPHLGRLLQRFKDARFLFDYAHDAGVVLALTRVLGSIGVGLPRGTADVVATFRPRVLAAAPALLAQQHVDAL